MPRTDEEHKQQNGVNIALCHSKVVHGDIKNYSHSGTLPTPTYTNCYDNDKRWPKEEVEKLENYFQASHVSRSIAFLTHKECMYGCMQVIYHPNLSHVQNIGEAEVFVTYICWHTCESFKVALSLCICVTRKQKIFGTTHKKLLSFIHLSVIVNLQCGEQRENGHHLSGRQKKKKCFRELYKNLQRPIEVDFSKNFPRTLRNYSKALLANYSPFSKNISIDTLVNRREVKKNKLQGPF